MQYVLMVFLGDVWYGMRKSSWHHQYKLVPTLWGKFTKGVCFVMWKQQCQIHSLYNFWMWLHINSKANCAIDQYNKLLVLIWTRYFIHKRYTLESKNESFSYKYLNFWGENTLSFDIGIFSRQGWLANQHFKSNIVFVNEKYIYDVK